MVTYVRFFRNNIVHCSQLVGKICDIKLCQYIELFCN